MYTNKQTFNILNALLSALHKTIYQTQHTYNTLRLLYINTIQILQYSTLFLQYILNQTHINDPVHVIYILHYLTAR